MEPFNSFKIADDLQFGTKSGAINNLEYRMHGNLMSQK